MAPSVIAILLICVVTYTTAQNQICGGNQTHYEDAVSWVLSQRAAKWGWPFNTAQAVLSLQLTNNSWYSEDGGDLTAQLSVKQLEIELVTDLAKPNPIFSPGILAYYIMALNATCHDVTNFHGFDLVDMLKQHMDGFPNSANFNNYFQYGLAVLALCQAGVEIDTTYVQKISEGSSTGAYQFGPDVASIALMAMACIEDSVPAGMLRKDLQKAMKRTENNLKSKQDTDGTWGFNEISTALATQGLLAAGVNTNYWDCESASQSVLDGQGSNGEINSLGGTLQILPLLASKTFADVKHIMPSCSDSSTGGLTGPDVEITLRVENGVDTTQANTIYTVTVAEGITLYEAMLATAAQNPTTFNFISPDSSFGHYIESMNGLASDAANSYYWTILIGDDRVSAPVGIDGILTEDGETYIFFYMSFAY